MTNTKICENQRLDWLILHELKEENRRLQEELKTEKERMDWLFDDCHILYWNTHTQTYIKNRFDIDREIQDMTNCSCDLDRLNQDL